MKITMFVVYSDDSFCKSVEFAPTRDKNLIFRIRGSCIMKMKMTKD